MEMEPMEGDPRNYYKIKLKVNAIFGHIELKHFYRQEDDWLVYYGYSIKYDRAGNEVSRTEPTAYSKIR